MLSTTSSAKKNGAVFSAWFAGFLFSRMLSTTTSANKMGLFFAVFAGFLFSRMLSTTTSANNMGLFFLHGLLASCFQDVEHDN